MGFRGFSINEHKGYERPDRKGASRLAMGDDNEQRILDNTVGQTIDRPNTKFAYFLRPGRRKVRFYYYLLDSFFIPSSRSIRVQLFELSALSDHVFYARVYFVKYFVNTSSANTVR